MSDPFFYDQWQNDTLIYDIEKYNFPSLILSVKKENNEKYSFECMRCPVVKNIFWCFHTYIVSYFREFAKDCARSGSSSLQVFGTLRN